VRNKLSTGNSTIGYVDKWLNNGFGGYKEALKKMKKNKDKEIIHDRFYQPDPLSLDGLRKKYPAHFLILNLLKKDQ